MNNCDWLVEALYQCFTTTILFPQPDQERFYRALCGMGYAEEANQGHAGGYRITPSGYQVAMARWGHVQQDHS